MSRKTICLPGLSDLDLSPIQPIVESATFQKLQERNQLGLSYLVFPGAQHSRLEHSLGTYLLTKRRTDRLLEESIISAKMAHNTNLYALLHDIGHFPLSHDIEALCNGTHNDHGLVLLEQLREEIGACEGEFNLVRALFTRKNFLSCCVSHPWFGTDKIHYISFDNSRTVEGIGFRVDDLINHISIHNGDLAIDNRFASEIETFLRCYIYMFDRVYLRKACVAIKRFLQKLVLAEMEAGRTLTPENLPDMEDFELKAALKQSVVPKVGDLFYGLLNKRRWPRTAVLLTPEGTTTRDRLDGKSIAEFKVAASSLEKLEKLSTDYIARLEISVAEMAGIDPIGVLVIPRVGLRRFTPRDVRVYDGRDYIGMFLELNPSCEASLNEIARARLCVRVCVMPEHREKVSQPQIAQGIRDLLLEAVV